MSHTPEYINHHEYITRHRLERGILAAVARRGICGGDPFAEVPSVGTCHEQLIIADILAFELPLRLSRHPLAKQMVRAVVLSRDDNGEVKPSYQDNGDLCLGEGVHPSIARKTTQAIDRQRRRWKR